MWNTTIQTYDCGKLILAKIQPTKWIDGGYEIGHLQTNGTFKAQSASGADITIDSERIERWIEINDLERVLA